MQLLFMDGSGFPFVQLLFSFLSAFHPPPDQLYFAFVPASHQLLIPFFSKAGIRPLLGHERCNAITLYYDSSYYYQYS